MSRITETLNATLTTEAVSPRITINWKPVDDTGVIHFQVQKMEYVNGEFVRLLPDNDIYLSMEEFMSKPVVVGGVEVSPLTIIGYINGLFDVLYTERNTPAGVTDPVVT